MAGTWIKGVFAIYITALVQSAYGQDRNLNPCPSGRPLDGYFCGIGPNSAACPRNYRCVTDPADSLAVCCSETSGGVGSVTCPSGGRSQGTCLGFANQQCASGLTCTSVGGSLGICCSSSSPGLCRDGRPPVTRCLGRFCGLGLNCELVNGASMCCRSPRPIPGSGGTGNSTCPNGERSQGTCLGFANQQCASGLTCRSVVGTSFGICCTSSSPGLCRDGRPPVTRCLGQVCGLGLNCELVNGASMCCRSPRPIPGSGGTGSSTCPNGERSQGTCLGFANQQCASGLTCRSVVGTSFGICCTSSSPGLCRDGRPPVTRCLGQVCGLGLNCELVNGASMCCRRPPSVPGNTCPPTQRGPCLGIYRNECRSDNNCRRPLKCCEHVCGRRCKFPIFARG